VHAPIELPTIPEAEQTPWVKHLLGLVEELAQRVARLEEEKGQLTDEIAVLKGEKKRPTFKSSKMHEQAGNDSKSRRARRRRGSKKRKKRKKTQHLQIHEDEIIAPSEVVPPGSRFKGYRDFVVQGLIIKAHNTRYRLQRWLTPDGQALAGQLPAELGGGHFDGTLVSYMLYQHHHCQVTQPLLLEQLREWGVDISSGQLNELLSANKERFHEEKDALLSAGLSSTGVVTVDDTGARHQGNNGYVTHIGNEFFAWFASTASKSRINFLELLRGGAHDYRVDDQAQAYWSQHKLPQGVVEKLAAPLPQCFVDVRAWEAHLDILRVRQPRHRQIATEGALLASAIRHGVPDDLAIISDDAGQFDVLLHGLCWIHAERLVHRLIPLNDLHREDQQRVRGLIWDFYRELGRYKDAPSPERKAQLEAQFDSIFTTRTRFETLNQALKRLHRNKSELLLVLDRPDVPLHTNGSEGDIRDYVKKRKVSGGTRSDVGRRCRDTFASLKKTCRKLGISFWHYLQDRVGGHNHIPPLPELIHQHAAPQP
jgi:hypothetical protein